MKTVAVKVTYILSPDLFWVIDTENNTDIDRKKLENLEKQEPERIFDFHYEIGSNVIANIDGHWKRVKLEEMLYTTRGLMYNSFLLDYGKYALVPKEKIRKIPPEFDNIDYMALKVKLNGVSPAKQSINWSEQKTILDYSTLWTHASYKYVQKLLDKTLEVILHPIRFDKNVLITDISLDVAGDMINLAEALIQREFALPPKDLNSSITQRELSSLNESTFHKSEDEEDCTAFSKEKSKIDDFEKDLDEHISNSDSDSFNCSNAKEEINFEPPKDYSDFETTLNTDLEEMSIKYNEKNIPEMAQPMKFPPPRPRTNFSPGRGRGGNRKESHFSSEKNIEQKSLGRGQWLKNVKEKSQYSPEEGREDRKQLTRSLPVGRNNSRTEEVKYVFVPAGMSLNKCN